MSRILAVDDEQNILFTLRAIGKVANFNITTANDGFRALQILSESKFDLIIVDYHMPNMNGLTLVKKIRELYLNIPILVLTVDESIELANKFIDVGATDFAVKPIRIADLIYRVKLHLRLSQVKKTEEKLLEAENFNLPHGMTFVTLQIILDYFKKYTTSETINTISEKTGLAYQTVHRYLDYLLKEDYVGVEMSYGKIGRPIHKYYVKRI